MEPTQVKHFTPSEELLAVSLELSKSSWKVALHDGQPLPAQLKVRLERECGRLELATRQLAALEAGLVEVVRCGHSRTSRYRAPCHGRTSTTAARSVRAWGSHRSPTTAAKAAWIKVSASRATDECARRWLKWPGSG